MCKEKVLTKTEVDSKLEQYFSTLRPNSVNVNKARWKKYCQFHGMTTEELINEALSEQMERVPLNELKLYDRLLDFRSHQLQCRKLSTVNSYIQVAKTIYKWFRIAIPDLPRLNIKNAILTEPIEYDDIINLEQIKEALELCKPSLKARCMCQVTGGYNFDETQRMSIRKFIDDTFRDHQCEDDEDALIYLSKSNNVIWRNKTVRGKTKKPYYGFCNPETVQEIAKQLLYSDYQERDKLFLHSYKYCDKLMTKVNNQLGFKKVGDYKLFRSHMLRKYNATHLAGDRNSEYRLTPLEVDELQGRSKNSVQGTYMKSDPYLLELLYCKAMNNVSIYNTYSFEEVDGRIVVECITNKKEEILQQKVDAFTNPTEGLKNLISEIGSDVFMSQVSDLANGK